MAGIQPTVTVDWSPTTNPLATPSWVNVPRWRSIQTSRGRQNEVDQIGPGTATIVLDNRDRRFDPLYTSGTNYPNVLPMKRFRVQSTYNAITSLRLPGTTGSYVSTPDSAAIDVMCNKLTANQSGIETDASGWQNAVNAVVTQTAAQALDGTKSLSMASVAAGLMGAQTPPAQYYAISPNQSHTMSAWFRAATTGQACRVQLAWYDASKAFISQATSVNVNDVTTGWTQITVTGTSPANAAYAQLLPVVTNTAGAGEVHYVDRVSLVQGTGDLDLRVKATLDHWGTTNQDLLCKWGASGNQSYVFRQLSDGTLGLFAQPSIGAGKFSTATVPFTAGSTGWVRVTMDVDNGSSQNVVTFYTSTDGSTWTQLGSALTSSGTAPINASTAAVGLGDAVPTLGNPVPGNVFYAEVRAGINGTVVASPSFDTRTPNGSLFTSPSTLLDAQGNTWTRQGTASFATSNITYDLFQGFVESWDQAYVNPRDATVSVRLNDFFDVLNGAEFPSSVYELEVRADSPSHWWRLGALQGSYSVDQIGTSHGLSHGGVTFGQAGAIANDSDTSAAFNGTDGWIDFGSGAVISTMPYSLEFWFKVATISGPGDRYLIAQGTNAATTGPPVAGMSGSDAGDPGKLSVSGVTAPNRLDDGAWHHVVYTVASASAGAANLYVDGVATNGTTAAAPFGSTFQVGAPSQPSGSYLVSRFFWPGSVDEIAIYPTVLSAARVAAHNSAGRTPWSGDTTGARVGRVLDYLGIAAGDRNVDTTTSTLQSAVLNESLLAHLQAINDVEQGLFFMTKDGKVRFRGRAAGFNLPTQITFGDGTGELRYKDVAFDYSKQLIFNVIRRQNANGQLMEASDSTSLGQFGRRVDSKSGMLGNSDLAALDLATYRLSKAKNAVERVRQLVVNLERDPTNLYPQALAREIGDTVTIKRRPQNVGAAASFDARVEGIAHTITPQSWTTTFRLSPADTDLYLQLDATTGPGLGSVKLAY